MDLRNRIWNLVSPEPMSGCWLWIGSVSGSGYGTISIANRSIRAHRASYEAFVGPIPNGLGVLHRCDTTMCVNPSHLFVGTQHENMLDASNKNRLIGCGNFRNILTPDQITEILRSKQTQRSIAKRFNVHQKTIWRIRTGDKHLADR